MATHPGNMEMIPPSQEHPYYPDPANDVTGGLPINLGSLRDGPPGSKPFYPYSTLIRYAIKGSPSQKLLLEDIYFAIETRFPYFRTALSGWKNSVRHNLSLNPCFEKVPRPLTDRGKGSYWTVNDNVDPRTGVHRVRKKRPKPNTSQQQHEQQEQHSPEQQMSIPFDTAVDIPFPMFGANTALTPQVMPTVGKRRNEQEGYEGVQDVQYSIEGGIGFLEEQLRPELDEHGNPDWRSIWHNELIKLRAFTAEQDKADADPEWYRMMVARVRGRLVPVDPDGMPIPTPPTHHGPIDHDIPEDGNEEQERELERQEDEK